MICLALARALLANLNRMIRAKKHVATVRRETVQQNQRSTKPIMPLHFLRLSLEVLTSNTSRSQCRPHTLPELQLLWN